MKATALLFPSPVSIREHKGRVRLPETISSRGAPVPAWLRRRLARACRAAGMRLVARSAKAVELKLTPAGFGRIGRDRLRDQAYALRLAADGAAEIASPSIHGLRHGVVTLCLLLEAHAAGAVLAPVTISDAPAFEVRGIQIDMAREFFPPMPYLRKVVDRMIDLKLNTLWLYVENHFHAPGLEDISPRGGLTPADAEAISAYAAERGVDVVPGTNLLSHMEGWFRLERYADFCDGPNRSYPVLTRAESLRLTKQYVDELIRAFPSPNFHAGFDELLFTGVNPEAAQAIRRMGKAAYFGEFSQKLIRHIQARGKVVWFWDDMVIGKNVFRKEGFNEDAPKALAYFPKDTVLVHWWYWADEDGKHGPMIRRVAESGRRFVVAPSIITFKHDYGSLTDAVENQRYMAESGRKHGAFGYVCTQWESRYGNSFEASWPLLALSAGQAWTGGQVVDDAVLRALSFAVTGETTGALGGWLREVSAVDDFIGGKTGRRGAFRSDLFLGGPHYLWRRMSPVLDARDRAFIAGRLRAAAAHLAALGRRDPALNQALLLPMDLLGEGLRIMAAFDHAWAEYHRAALVERDPKAAGEFGLRIHNACARLRQAGASAERLRRRVLRLERATGHTAYDGYALGRHASDLRDLIDLVRAVAEDRGGLPYFEKLLYRPDSYCVSNLRQMQVQNTLHVRHAGLPWPVRRGKLSSERL